NIRQIQSWKDAKIRFEEMLPLLGVDFVRSDQLTVYPFPFKYMTEFFRITDAENISDPNGQLNP
ncbi:MAG: hypothetical protein Q4B26_19575, partial [Eubacteriales bacterium]|nr:hypothetical protein [Eubacteriales bacterium]